MKKLLILSALLVTAACNDKSHDDDHNAPEGKTVKALEAMGGNAKAAAEAAGDKAAAGAKDLAAGVKASADKAANKATEAAVAAGNKAENAAGAVGDAAKGAVVAAADATKDAATAVKVAVSDKSMAEAKNIFKTRCVACHGSTGKGDGAAAAALNPKPRAYNDQAWQKSVTDEYLAKVILKGGTAVGKSALMPGNADLEQKPEVVAGLVSIIRGFAK